MKYMCGCDAAKYLRVKSPIPYRLRKLMPQHLKYGMNFAFGGTGVFNTFVPLPNMTTQIDFLEQLIKDKVYTTLDLTNSVALVSVAGNDYGRYMLTNGSQVNNYFELFILVKDLFHVLFTLEKTFRHYIIYTMFNLDSSLSPLINFLLNLVHNSK